MKLVKICGLTRKIEAEYVNSAHADFAGMVLFVPKSKRNIDIDTAKEIMACLKSSVKSVAVTISPDGEQLKVIQEAGFDYVQIHGEIDDELIKGLSIPVIKAFNVHDLSKLSKYLDNPHVAGFIFDAATPGSGEGFDYSLIKELPDTDKFTLLAGGLNPSNVSCALKNLKVSGADTSSGVENESGNGKDPEKIMQFSKEVHEAEGIKTNWEINTERLERIELSIRKKFHRQLFTPFAKAINTYELLKPGDKVAVCISGGKDSMLCAKLFQELKRHRKFDFELVFLVMDPGYNPENRKLIEENAKTLGIPTTIFESDIFQSVTEVTGSPCYLCARMRRGYLYSRAQALGCNKIALGHHYDDVIETILMGMLYGAQIQTMMPKLHSTNFPGMELIRPMYLIREDDIKAWRDYNGLRFLQCACRFTEICDRENPDEPSVSKRLEIKRLIAELKKTNPFVEGNIFKSVENVCLDTVIAYKADGERHSFLENYDDKC